jgi:hypothetical protein
MCEVSGIDIPAIQILLQADLFIAGMRRIALIAFSNVTHCPIQLAFRIKRDYRNTQPMSMNKCSPEKEIPLKHARLPGAVLAFLFWTATKIDVEALKNYASCGETR